MLDAVTSRLRKGALTLLGRSLPTEPVLRCQTHILGDSAYGAWTFCPDKLAGGALLYSFGVGEDISWDLAMIEEFGVTIHAFDPTPRSAAFVKRQKLPKQFVFHDYGIADYDGVARFYPPENSEWVSHTLLERKATANKAIEVPVRRLESIMSSLGHRKVDLIKMDIEGAEYAVLQDILACETPAGGAGQLLVEFHHRFTGKGVAQTRASLLALEQKGFNSFHISANGEDWGFLRCG